MADSGVTRCHERLRERGYVRITSAHGLQPSGGPQKLPGFACDTTWRFTRTDINDRIAGKSSASVAGTDAGDKEEDNKA